MDIKQILNDALNKALITDRITGVPNSNKIATFVNKYVKTEQLTIHSIGNCAIEQTRIGNIHKNKDLL